jgi:hypothetical protein
MVVGAGLLVLRASTSPLRYVVPRPLARLLHEIQNWLWQGASRVPRRSALKCVTKWVTRSEHSQGRFWTQSLLLSLL